MPRPFNIQARAALVTDWPAAGESRYGFTAAAATGWLAERGSATSIEPA